MIQPSKDVLSKVLKCLGMLLALAALTPSTASAAKKLDCTAGISEQQTCIVVLDRNSVTVRLPGGYSGLRIDHDAAGDGIYSGVEKLSARLLSGAAGDAGLPLIISARPNSDGGYALVYSPIKIPAGFSIELKVVDGRTFGKWAEEELGAGELTLSLVP